MSCKPSRVISFLQTNAYLQTSSRAATWLLAIFFFPAYNSQLWLKQQMVHGGAAQWLEQNQPPVDSNQHNCLVPTNEVRSVYVAGENLLNTRA